MLQIAAWVSQNAGTGQFLAAIMQALASAVLVFVTWNYVRLTKKLADAAEGQHAETVRLHDERRAPNLLLVQPVDSPGYVGNLYAGPTSINQVDRQRLHLVNLGPGTMWITSWEVAVQAEARNWTTGPEGPNEPLLRPGGVHAIYAIPLFRPRTFHEPGAVDEFGNPLSNEPGVHTVVFMVHYFYSETGPEKHVAHFLIEKNGDDVSIARFSKHD